MLNIFYWNSKSIRLLGYLQKVNVFFDLIASFQASGTFIISWSLTDFQIFRIDLDTMEDSNNIKSVCVFSCDYPIPLGAIYLIVLLTAIIASYYTYQIRICTTYFRQTKVLAILIAIFVPTIVSNLVFLYFEPKKFLLFR